MIWEKLGRREKSDRGSGGCMGMGIQWEIIVFFFFCSVSIFFLINFISHKRAYNIPKCLLHKSLKPVKTP